MSSFGASTGSSSYTVNTTLTGAPGVGLGIGGTLPGINEVAAAGLYGTFTLNGNSITTWVEIVAKTDGNGVLTVDEFGPAGQLYSSGNTISGDTFTAYAVSLFDGTSVGLSQNNTITFSGTLTLAVDPPSFPIFDIDPLAIPPGGLPPGFIGAGAGAPAPEPSTLALLGIGGALGLGWRRAHRRRMIA
jgi:hypothetical protein